MSTISLPRRNQFPPSGRDIQSITRADEPIVNYLSSGMQSSKRSTSDRSISSSSEKSRSRKRKMIDKLLSSKLFSFLCSCTYFLLTPNVELQFNNHRNKSEDDRDMMVISWPYDAIHKTHIHFDKATGEMTLGKAPDWEICKSPYNSHKNKQTNTLPFLVISWIRV